MQPTRPEQYTDALADRVPRPDEVGEGIWSIPLPMDQPGNPFSLCYVIAGSDGSLHLIDSGVDTDENWQLLGDGLRGFGHSLDDVASLFVTHLHPDHLGLAERLRAASGAKVGMMRREHEAVQTLAERGLIITEQQLAGWGMPEAPRAELLRAFGSAAGTAAAHVDVDFDADDRLDIPGRTVTVLATPGHTAGSACLVDPDSGVLFTGDTVLPKIFAGLGLGDRSASNPIADYLASLRALAKYDELEVAPGHGFRFRGLNERTAELAEHHLKRSRAAAAIIRDEPDATVWEVASRLHWTAGWSQLTGFYLLSALAQTQLHLEFARSDEYPG